MTNSIPFTEKEQMREMTLRIIRKAKTDGIETIPDANNINPKDAAFIRESYTNA